MGPFPKGLQGWTLPFANLQMLFRPYGVRLLHQPATYASTSKPAHAFHFSPLLSSS